MDQRYWEKIASTLNVHTFFLSQVPKDYHVMVIFRYLIGRGGSLLESLCSAAGGRRIRRSRSFSVLVQPGLHQAFLKKVKTNEIITLCWA